MEQVVCNTFVPHAWVATKCRDCGHPKASHDYNSSSDGRQPQQSSRPKPLPRPRIGLKAHTVALGERKPVEHRRPRRLPPPPPTPPKGLPTQSAWPCSNCTFLNNKDLTYCEICEEPKPESGSVTPRSVEVKYEEPVPLSPPSQHLSGGFSYLDPISVQVDHEVEDDENDLTPLIYTPSKKSQSDIQAMRDTYHQKQEEFVKTTIRKRSHQIQGSTFATKLLHKHQHVLQQVEAGMYTLKRLRGFFKRFVRIQDTFSRAVHGLVQEERQKLERFAGSKPDRMATTYRTWKAVLETMERMATDHRDFSTECTLGLFQPLDAFYTIGTARVNEVQSSFSKATADWESVDVQLAKKREACLSLIDDLQKNEGSKLRQKVFKACEQYDVAQRNAQQKREAYFLRDLPSALEEMQVIEEMRLQNSQLHIEGFARLQTSFAASMNTISAELERVVGDLNPDTDINYFLNHCESVYGQPPEWKPYQYDLPKTLEELSVDMAPSQNSVFGSTIPEIMRAQEITCPNLDYAGVPRILFVLDNTIRQCGGFTTEGIFRVSARESDVVALRTQVASGDYEIKTDNPHVPAALLKFWLRDLREPLIPFSCYHECISLGKEELDDPDQSSHLKDRIEAALAQIPAENRRVIDFLVTMICDVAAHHPVNKMTVKSLSIVFAPSFLRSDSDDPMVLFQDSRFAAQFLSHLIRLSGPAQRKHIDLLGAQPTRGSLSSKKMPLISLKEAQVRARQQNAPVRNNANDYTRSRHRSMTEGVKLISLDEARAKFSKTSSQPDLTQVEEASGRNPPLPPHWERHYSDVGDIYYWNSKTNESQWERPEY